MIDFQDPLYGTNISGTNDLFNPVKPNEQIGIGQRPDAVTIATNKMLTNQSDPVITPMVPSTPMATIPPASAVSTPMTSKAPMLKEEKKIPDSVPPEVAKKIGLSPEKIGMFLGLLGQGLSGFGATTRAYGGDASGIAQHLNYYKDAGQRYRGMMDQAEQRDPDSDISKLAREEAKKLGINVPETASLFSLKKVIPNMQSMIQQRVAGQARERASQQMTPYQREQLALQKRRAAESEGRSSARHTIPGFKHDPSKGGFSSISTSDRLKERTGKVMALEELASKMIDDINKYGDMQKLPGEVQAQMQSDYQSLMALIKDTQEHGALQEADLKFINTFANDPNSLSTFVKTKGNSIKRLESLIRNEKNGIKSVLGAYGFTPEEGSTFSNTSKSIPSSPAPIAQETGSTNVIQRRGSSNRRKSTPAYDKIMRDPNTGKRYYIKDGKNIGEVK